MSYYLEVSYYLEDGRLSMTCIMQYNGCEIPCIIVHVDDTAFFIRISNRAEQHRASMIKHSYRDSL